MFTGDDDKDQCLLIDYDGDGIMDSLGCDRDQYCRAMPRTGGAK